MASEVYTEIRAPSYRALNSRGMMVRVWRQCAKDGEMERVLRTLANV